MAQFTFKKSTQKKQIPLFIEDGVHVAVVVQTAHIGMQLPFNREEDPEAQMAVAFEIKSGDLITKRMKFSDHPSSFCFDLFTSAYPNLDESDEKELGLSDLLGKSVLIDVEVRDGTWPRVTGIMPLEDGFEPITPKTELLDFDADEMDREIYLKLHRDIRGWVSKRTLRPERLLREQRLGESGISCQQAWSMFLRMIQRDNSCA